MAFLKRVPVKGKEYWQIVESYRNEQGRPSHRTLAHLGRIDDSKKVEKIKAKLKAGFQIDDISNQGGLIHGSVATLLQIVRERGLVEQINSVVQKESGLRVGLTTCLLAINRLLPTPLKAKMNFADWISTTSLPRLTDIQMGLLSCENICNMMDYLDVETCRAIDRVRFEATPEIDRSQGFHYDLTSTFTFGYCNEMATNGYSRDHREDQQQVVIGLLNDSKQIPITSHVEPGNASDMNLFPITAEYLLPRFGLEHVTLVVDRGMISEDNINKVVDELGYGIVCMMRKSDGVTQRVMAEARNRELKVLKVAHGEDGGSLLAEIRGTSMVVEVYGQHRKVLVCHNPISAIQQSARRQNRLAQAESKLTSLKEKLSKRRRNHNQLVVAIDKCITGLKSFIQVEVVSEREMHSFEYELIKPGTAAKVRQRLAKQRKQLDQLQDNLLRRESYSASEQFIEKKLKQILGDDHGRYRIKIGQVQMRPSIRWTIDDAAVKAAEEDDGWFVLMASDLEATAEEILAAYEDKDGIEKAFRSMKNVIDIRPLYHHKSNRVVAHIWICMLAQYIRRMFELKLKEAGIPLTFEKAMNQLNRVFWDRMEATVLGDIKVRWNSQSSELNETQQALLGAFQVPQIPRI